MRIKLLLSGKNSPSYIADGCQVYEKRIKHYLPFEITYLSELKLSRSMTNQQLKDAESAIFIKGFKETGFLILLDEKGKSFNSATFSSFMASKLDIGTKDLVFAIGGAHGFNNEIKKKASEIISLSALTFPHQLARLIFLEQLYRCFTIIKNEPYHHV